MRVLVCGAGIAGLTLAWRLRQLGHTPLIVEQAAGPRSGGYMIDFFGSGYDAAEKLDLLPDLERIHYPIARLAFLDASGSERFSLAYKNLRKRLFGGRHFNFMRGDLERVLYSKIEGQVEVRFHTTVDHVVQEADGVEAALSDGSKERCDLLVGADGVHSRVRRLVFGEEARFNRFLGFHTAAYIIDRMPRELHSTGAFDTLTVPGRQVAVYPIRGGRLATFFVHRSARPLNGARADTPLRELRRCYGDLGWIVPELLEDARDAGDLYFDDVSQIEMDRWSLGRVALLGDACQCVSLLAGQGASLAVAGAYILAEELNRQAGVEEALANYEKRLRPFVLKKQAAARDMARWFVPGNSVRLMIRDLVLRMAVWPVTSFFARRSIAGDSVFRT